VLEFIIRDLRPLEAGALNWVGFKALIETIDPRGPQLTVPHPITIYRSKLQAIMKKVTDAITKQVQNLFIFKKSETKMATQVVLRNTLFKHIVSCPIPTKNEMLKMLKDRFF
jgi:hypothetical protein